MPLTLRDRILDTTSTTGTGTITLDGLPPSGYEGFDQIGNGNTTYYVIVGRTTGEFEVGIGTYSSSGNTLARTTVLSSSAPGDVAVDFIAGTKDVFVTIPSSVINSIILNNTGTNTGDQTITLTGPITGSGTGSFATTITNGAVTLSKLADMATGSLYYRKTAGTGAPEVQTLATLKTDLGLTGTNTGDQTITLTGNVTGTGTGSFATTIANGVVTLAMHANMATSRILGRVTPGSGVPEELTGANVMTIIGAATTGANGYLTSTDWNTFKGKQATLVSNTNIKTIWGATVLGSGDVGTAPVGYGGTGQTTYTNGQLLIGNTTGNTLTKATLTQGTGITITNGTGSITIANASPMTYAGAGIAVSTGSAWGTSLTAPSGTIVGTSDTQTLSAKTLTLVKYTTSAAVTAGTNAQGQGALTSDINFITTNSSNPGGVTLPATAVGQVIVVYNNTANPLNVYPPSSSSIDGLSNNTSVQIPAGGGAEFFGRTTTAWHSTLVFSTSGINMNNTNVTKIKNATYDSQVTRSGTTGAQTVDWTTGNCIKQPEPTGTITFTFTAPPGACHLQLLIDSDGTSTAQTINWPGTVIWLSSTWAAVANKKAVINFWYDGTNYYAMGSNQV